MHGNKKEHEKIVVLYVFVDIFLFSQLFLFHC